MQHALNDEAEAASRTATRSDAAAIVPTCSLRAILRALQPTTKLQPTTNPAALSAASDSSSIVAVAAAAVPPSFPAAALRLPSTVGHHRRCELFVTATVRALLVLTPRLTFVSLGPCGPDEPDDETSAASAAPVSCAADSTAAFRPSQNLVQLVLKLNDATGWGAAQQLVVRPLLRVGTRIALHAFVEINSNAGLATALAAAASAAPSSSSAESTSASAAALPAVQLWRQVAPKQTHSHSTASNELPDASSSAAAAASSSSCCATAATTTAAAAAAAPLPPVDPRLTLHAISLALIDDGADLSRPASIAALHALTVKHSAEFAAAMAEADANKDASAVNAADVASASLLDLTAVRVFPHVDIALRERSDIAQAAEQKRLAKLASTAAASSAAASSSVASPSFSPDAASAVPALLPPPTDRAALAAYYKALNKQKQQQRTKRAPKQNRQPHSHTLHLCVWPWPCLVLCRSIRPHRVSHCCFCFVCCALASLCFLFATPDNRGLKFFDFLHATFGSSVLSSGGGVLDVAGGQGQLSFELSKRDYPCTIVDPRRLVEGSGWDKRRARYLSLRGRIAAELGSRSQPTVAHLQTCFDAAFPSAPETRGAWLSASLIVGLHPDQASDAIVQLSLAERRPFAIVPCCVFPNDNPHRKLKSGEHVKTHEQLCQVRQTHTQRWAGTGSEAYLDHVRTHPCDRCTATLVPSCAHGSLSGWFALVLICFSLCVSLLCVSTIWSWIPRCNEPSWLSRVATPSCSHSAVQRTTWLTPSRLRPR